MAKRKQPQRSQGPSGLVVGGIAAAVIALLVLALVVANSGGDRPSDPGKTVSVAAPTLAPTPTRTSPPRRPTQSATPTRTPEPTSSPAPEQAEQTRNKPSFIQGEFEWATVKSVTDGDTLKLADGRKVRLLGINTPERKKPLYREAGDALRDLAGAGTHVVIEFDGARKDRYGRLLAYIHTADGTFVNGEILRQGMAFAFLYPTTKIRRATLIALSKEAREKRLGVWKIETPKPGSTYVGNTRAPYFHHPSCKRTQRIRRGSKRTFSSRDEAFESGMMPCKECDS